MVVLSRWWVTPEKLVILPAGRPLDLSVRLDAVAVLVEVVALVIDGAEGHLNWVLKNQKAPLVQALAAQRLGIVLLQQKKYDAAIAALNTKVEADFEPLLLEAKGDVYVAQNKTKEAAQSYQQALEKLPKEAIERELLQMKLDSQK